MSAHTPGPWKVMPEEVDKPYIRVRGTVLGGRFKIANVPTPTHDGATAHDVQETRANARLIAAAPDMLVALRLGYRMALQVDPTSRARLLNQPSLCRMRDALAAAEGRTPEEIQNEYEALAQ